MLAYFMIFGYSLFHWYVLTIIASFCIMMMGNTYIKQKGFIPQNISMWPATLFLSIIPIINVLCLFSVVKTLIRFKVVPDYEEQVKKSLESILSSNVFNDKKDDNDDNSSETDVQ